MLRRFLEAYSRDRVVKRYLPARFGRNLIVVTPDSALSYWKRDLDRSFRSLFDWAETYVSSGNVVWDIGANVGLFAFAAASRAGKNGHILAVEPDPFLVQLLHLSVEAKAEHFAPVDVIPAAISDRCKMTCLFVAVRGRSANHLADVSGSTMHGGVRQAKQVVAMTLDRLSELSRPPDLIKIDIEGAELQALRGGQAVLQKHRPLIICEVRPDLCTRLADFLGDRDYALFDAVHPDQGECSVASFNTLAIPRDKVRQYVS